MGKIVVTVTSAVCSDIGGRRRDFETLAGVVPVSQSSEVRPPIDGRKASRYFAKWGSVGRVRLLPLVVSACVGLLCVLCLTPGDALADWHTGAVSTEVTGPIDQWASPAGGTFLNQSYTVDYQGGTAAAAGSATSSATFYVDDGMEIDITHPDGTTTSLSDDFSHGCQGYLSDDGPFDLSSYLQTGFNIVTIRLYDICGFDEGDGPALWLDFSDAAIEPNPTVPPITVAEHRGLGNPAIPAVCNCAQSPGEPVNTATGDFYDTSTDASVRSFGPPVAFTRTYDATLAQTQAASGVPGALGYGWSDNWDSSLAFNDPYSGDVTVEQADGAEVTFVPPVSGSCPTSYDGPGTSGTYCALADVTATLTYDSATSKYTFITHPYAKDTFNSSGELTGESGPGGAAVSLTYDSPSPGSGHCPSAASTCTTVTSASGRALVLAYSSSGLIIRVTDPSGSYWTYAHCSPPSSTCSAGDLTSLTDPAGNVTSFTYAEGDSNSNMKHDLLTLTKPTGQSGGTHPGADLVNTYNSSGQVELQTDPDGNQTSFDYSNLDVALGAGDTVVTDPDGNETEYSFNDGVLVGKTDGYGSENPSTWTYGRDPDTLMKTSVTDPDSNETQYAFDADGNVTSVTNPLGDVTTYAYNSFDERTCRALPLAASGCASLSPPSAITGGGTISPPSSAPPKYVTYSLYDTAGNVIYQTAGDYAPGASSASQSRTSYRLYNGESVTLGSGTDDCAASAPDSSLPCATINPDRTVTQLGYDSTTGSVGDLLSSSTPDGNSGSETAKTTYTYTDNGQLSTETAPDGNVSGATAALYRTTNTYTDDGWLHTVTVSETSGDITARETTYGYDGDGNPTSITDPRDKETTYSFDADDQQTLVSDPDGHHTLTCYDGDGNITQTVPAVGVAANSLTPASCPTSFPDDYGVRRAADATTYAYDALGDQTTVTSPAPAGQTGHETTTNTYDAAGLLQNTVTPPASTTSGAPDQEAAYTYDAAGEVLSVTTEGTDSSDASMTSYCYDPNGERTATVAPDGNTSGTPATCSGSSPYQTSSAYQTGYEFDSLGELVSRTRPATTAASDGQTTSLTYDPAGNVLTTEDANGVTVTNTYTPLNQVATRSYSGSSAPPVSYTYDANGNRVAMSDGTGDSSYVYDPFNELTSYENGAGKTVTYNYDGDGDVTSIGYPLTGSWATGHQSVDYTFDDAGLMTAVTPFGGTAISIDNTADGLPSSLTLGASGDTLTTSYDSTDSPSQITLTDSGTTLQQFAYDYYPSGAVSSETDSPALSTSTSNYGFDASGNATTLPTSTSGTFDNASELTSTTVSGTTTDYGYNADGERTGATVSGTSTMTATYNGAQTLTSYDDTAADMTAATYDGDGLRQSDTTGGTTTNFVWNPTGSVPSLLEDSTNAYAYGPGSAPIEQVNLSTGTIKYLISDRLGSVRGIVASSGTLTATGSYDPAGNPQTSLASGTPFGYAGAYTDPTGLEYLINRYYDPTTNQFLTLDPLVDQTEQPYAYVADDPVNATDTDGASASVVSTVAGDCVSASNDDGGGDPPVEAGACAIGASYALASEAVDTFGNLISLALGQSGSNGSATTAENATPAEVAESVPGPIGCPFANDAATEEDAVTQIIKTRPEPGSDGGISNHIIGQQNGETTSVTHQVEVDGEVVHQHQTYVGKYGGQRQFPPEWSQFPDINAP